jgi:hypothetical protein
MPTGPAPVLVSVVVPCYNDRCLAEYVASVRSLNRGK